MFALANYFNRRRDGQNADGSARSGAAFIAKRFAQILYLGRQFVETAEWNEQADITFERLAAVGDNAFGPISLREGGTIVVDRTAATVRLGAARVWAGGYMHEVPAASLTGVPMVGVVPIGIAVREIVVEASDDVELKGVVPGSQSHGETQAARLRYEATWARAGDPFYPIHTIIDGQIPNEVAPPASDAAELLVERHLRETHGSHISEGFRVAPSGFDPATREQTYVIGAGVLRAQGRRVARSVDQRFRRVENPTLQTVNGETHLYPAGGVVILNNGPIADVATVTVIKEVERTITHQLAGGADALPDTPVYAIVSVKQGAKTYAQGADYVKTGDRIDWSPSGDEPAPGSTVAVLYRYIATVVPQAIGRQNVTLEAAVVGQPVTISYRWKLPRVDVLAIDLDGAVVYIEGVSTRFNPIPPTVPAPLAPLVRIENRWGIDPGIRDIDQRRLTEAEVRAMMRTLLDFGDLVSQISLERDIQERDPASRRGSFVDPFKDDLQRDLGIAQDAAVGGGLLQLPIEIFPRFVDVGRDAITLPFVKEVIQSQPFRTGSQRINEFLAFNPLPAQLSINPSVDRWNEVQSSSTSSSSSSFEQVNSYRPDLLGTDLYGTTSFSSSSSSSTSLASSSVTNIEFLRQIDVAFEARRMGPGENLRRVLFDGIDVTAGVTGPKKADATGRLVGTFRIPAGIRAGSKAVIVTGAGGSEGETGFVGQGTITTEVWVTSTHTHTVAVTIDPVAQSFVLPETRHVTGVRVEFTARGDAAKPVVLEIRSMEGSTPSATTLAEGVTPGTFALGDPAVARPANWTEIDLRHMLLVRAAEWRAWALLTDDPDHAIASAQLGDQSNPNSPRGFDARRQEWVRANPVGGDAFKGSNGKSWLVMPDVDYTYELVAARFTAATMRRSLGSFKLSDIHAGGISDLVVLLIVQEPSRDTRVRLELVRVTGEVIAFEPNARLQLDSYLTETVEIAMVLTGTPTLSPVIAPECQILWGRLKETASYVSEANSIDLSGGPVKVRTVAEIRTPGTSAVAVAVGNTGAFVDQVGPQATALGDGWVEREYLQSPYGSAEARTRITLTGTPKDRPAVRQLRQRATEV